MDALEQRFQNRHQLIVIVPHDSCHLIDEIFSYQTISKPSVDFSAKETGASPKSLRNSPEVFDMLSSRIQTTGC